jgi:hypothetical protein
VPAPGGCAPRPAKLADADADGVPDAADPCPTAAGACPAAVPRIGAAIKTKVRPGKRSSAFKRLTVTGLPPGARVEVRCTPKKRCPFTKKSVKVKNSRADALTLLTKSKRRRGLIFRRGAVVEVRITAPNTIGLVIRYAIRKGKRPTRKTLCLPPGSSKPATC